MEKLIADSLMDNQINKIIGSNILKIRRLNNEKQEELATILGITGQALSHYENGRRKIKTCDLYLIAKKYNVSLDYFLNL